MNEKEIQDFLVDLVINKPMKEYSQLIRQLIKEPDNEAARNGIKEIEEFFLSEPFMALTKTDGAEVVSAIHSALEKQGIQVSALLDGKENIFV